MYKRNGVEWSNAIMGVASTPSAGLSSKFDDDLGSNIFSQAFILRFKWQGMSVDLDMDVTFRWL